MERLDELFPAEKFYGRNAMCLYGEGYGTGIQKAGRNYNTDGNDFVLFDVRIDDWWLKRCAVEEIANSLEIGFVPVVGRGNISEAIEYVRTGFKSTWGDFQAEGLVLRTEPELYARDGDRIITKIKTKDFNKDN